VRISLMFMSVSFVICYGLLCWRLVHHPSNRDKLGKNTYPRLPPLRHMCAGRLRYLALHVDRTA